MLKKRYARLKNMFADDFSKLDRIEEMLASYEARIADMEKKVAVALKMAKEKDQSERTEKTRKWLTGYPDQTNKGS